MYLFSLKTIDTEDGKRKMLEIGGKNMKTLADLLIEEKVREIKDREYLIILLKKIIKYYYVLNLLINLLKNGRLI